MIKTYKAVAMVGDGIYNGYYFPKEELEKAFETIIAKPFVLDHSDDIEDVVGFVEDAWYNNPSMETEVGIDSELPKALSALKWIQKKQMRREIPEVSVALTARVDWDDIFEKDGEEYPKLKDMKFIHLALVTVGACSPEDGCGVMNSGLKLTRTGKDTVEIHFTATLSELKEEDTMEKKIEEPETLKVEVEMDASKCKEAIEEFKATVLELSEQMLVLEADIAKKEGEILSMTDVVTELTIALTYDAVPTEEIVEEEQEPEPAEAPEEDAKSHALKSKETDTKAEVAKYLRLGGIEQKITAPNEE
jgi:hypothetical protein